MKARVKAKPDNRRTAVTKRMVLSRSRQAFAKAAEATMQAVGYNVIARDNQVVKLMQDGSMEVIGSIQPRRKLTALQIKKALGR